MATKVGVQFEFPISGSSDSVPAKSLTTGDTEVHWGDQGFDQRFLSAVPLTNRKASMLLRVCGCWLLARGWEPTAKEALMQSALGRFNALNVHPSAAKAACIAGSDGMAQAMPFQNFS
jgi:hypothetical protein